MRFGAKARAQLAVLVLSASCAKPEPASTPAAPAPVAPAAPVAERGRLPDGVRPIQYRLIFEVDPDRSSFNGQVSIDIELDAPHTEILLHAQDLRPKRVGVRQASKPGAPPRDIAATLIQVSETGLAKLRSSAPIERGPATIDIAYEADFDAHLRGLYRVESAGVGYAFTQMEPISARRAFPGFDEPRFKTPFEIALRIPNTAVGIANTREVESVPWSSELKELRFARTEPLPTYLVAIAVGPLDVRIAPDMVGSGRPAVPLRGVAPRGRAEDLAFALDETPKLIESLERYLGVGYPYDKLDLIAVPDFVAGAMENAGAITFRDSLLLVKSDAPEWQRRANVGINAHELAHQWFGDLVTMPWWDDLWLNEAFATWMGGRVVDEVHPEYDAGPERLLHIDRAMNVDSKPSARRIRQPIESEHDISNAFDAITYTKGSSVIGMFERYLGAERFRAGLKLYLERHRFRTATAADLLRALGDASGEPIADAFSTFLEQPGVPTVSAELVCPANGPPRVHLEQKRYTPLGMTLAADQSWQIPVCLRFGFAPIPGAAPAETREQCTLLRDRSADVALEASACPAFVMPNAAGKGYYRWWLPGQGFRSLLDRATALSVEERLSTMINAGAAVRAGDLAFGELMAVLKELTRSEPGRLARREFMQAAIDWLGSVRDSLLTDGEEASYRATVRELLSPQFRELGLLSSEESAETGQSKLLRALVVSGLAFEAMDTALRSDLNRLGRAELGLERDDRLGRLPSELREVALGVAVQQGGDPVVAVAMQALARSTDGLERSRLLGALGSNRDPSLAPRVLALALDGSLRENEILSPLFGQARRRETRDIAFRWLEQHYDELVARLGHENATPLISVTGGYCTRADAEHVERFFQPRVEALTGGPRNLMLTLETIRLCAAFAEAYRTQATAYFQGRAPGSSEPSRRPAG